MTMDILEIRKQNLKLLLKGYKTNKAFADAVDIAPARISQVLTGQANSRGKPVSVGPIYARKIEEKLNLPHGWMDTLQLDNATIEATEGGATTVTVRPQGQSLSTDRPPRPRKIADEIHIPMFDVAFSMGNGSFQPDHDDIISAVTVTNDWVNSNLPNITSAHNLRIGSGRGDSMLGTYSHGDMLFIDSGVHDVPFDGVYAFMLNEQLYIKRLQKRPDGAYNMISDNKQYDAFIISSKDNFHVFGRVVWAWNGRKL